MSNPLRRLDDRLVPALAAFFDRLIPRPPEPAGPLPVILRLRRWDDQWAGRGPLALIREVPQLGALLLAALILVNGVTVKQRTERRQAAEERAVDQGPEGEDRTAIGPTIGASVRDYAAEARQRLADGSSGQPDAAAVGVVSFGKYLTPAQVQEAVGVAAVVRIFYRPQPMPLTEADPQAEGESVVTDLQRDARKEFLRLAVHYEQEAKNLQGVISTNDHDPAQKAEDERERDRHLRRARILRGDCACIYGVVVETKLRVLAGLTGRPNVRVIDPSVPNARITDYEGYTALLPEERVTVTGGNQAA